MNLYSAYIKDRTTSISSIALYAEDMAKFMNETSGRYPQVLTDMRDLIVECANEIITRLESQQ